MPVEYQGGHKRSEMRVPVERERAAPHIRLRVVMEGLHVVEENSAFLDQSKVYLVQRDSCPSIVPVQRNIEGILGV